MIGINIRTLRREKNMTQQILAKKLNVSPGTIAMWENGQRTPTIDKLKELAKEFNVSIDWLVEGKANSIEVKLQKTENTITLLGRNGMFKTYTLNDSQIKSIESITETLIKGDSQS